jgi:hypothetical protein
MVKIEYDKSVEVTEKQYKHITNEFCGFIAHRIENGRYFIKVWLMRYAKHIEQIINS